MPDLDIDAARLRPHLRGRTRGKLLRACAGCGRRCVGPRCPGCTPAVAYDAEHRRIRAALLPAAVGRLCALCRQPMLAGQLLELDHSVPVVAGGRRGDRIVHASCNARAGAALVNRGLEAA